MYDSGEGKRVPWAGTGRGDRPPRLNRQATPLTSLQLSTRGGSLRSWQAAQRLAAGFRIGTLRYAIRAGFGLTPRRHRRIFRQRFRGFARERGFWRDCPDWELTRTCPPNPAGPHEVPPDGYSAVNGTRYPRLSGSSAGHACLCGTPACSGRSIPVSKPVSEVSERPCATLWRQVLSEPLATRTHSLVI